MAADPDRIDVVRLMRAIRENTRSRHREIERHIERARKALLEDSSLSATGEIRHYVQTLHELFDQQYERVLAYLRDQEPNYANIQFTLSEINRVLAERDLSGSRLGPWWDPRTWIKRLLAPLRRFVLRQQHDVNALVRDTLTYLVRHTGHLEIQRAELEIGIQQVRAIGEIYKRIDALCSHLIHLPGVTQRPVFEYVDDTLERFSELQRDEQEKVLRAERDRVRQRLDEIHRATGARLERIERHVAEIAPAAGSEIVGFDSLRFAEGLRGEEETVGRQQTWYAERLHGRGRVLDCGCGRGELLAVLAGKGIEAYGVDVDESMVRRCREQGLDARCEDVIDHLAGLPDASLGGVVALQLIEHFDFPRLMQFFRLVGRKVGENGVAVVETVNPACLTVFSGAFYADPTHFRPLHPEATRHLLEMVGFASVEIVYLNPTKDTDKLKTLTLSQFKDPALRQAAETLNADIERLNTILYGCADYAAIGRRATDG